LNVVALAAATRPSGSIPAAIIIILYQLPLAPIDADAAVLLLLNRKADCVEELAERRNIF
jgi:hypothetical protein